MMESHGLTLKRQLVSTRAVSVYINMLRTLLSLLLAVGFSVVLIIATSQTPADTIRIFFTAPFATPYSAGMILTQAVPLIFTGVGVAIMVKGGQFNMIGEGTFFAGAFIGAVLAVDFAPLNGFAPAGAIIATCIMTALIGYIPAKLKAWLNVNEFVSSLMLNFILYWVVMYLFGNVFFDPDYSSLATRYIENQLPYLSFENEISSSIIIAVLAAIGGYVFLYRTKWGYALRMTGDNPDFAAYTGINVKKYIVVSQIIGAAVAGLGGAVFLLGNSYRFTWKSLPNYGFDGFIVAIMAYNNPLFVPLSALLLAYLRVGAMEMARLSDVPNEIIYIIQAIMILFVGGQALLARLKAKAIRKVTEKEEKDHV